MIRASNLLVARLSVMPETPLEGEASANAQPRVETETTFALIQRAHADDDEARNELCSRYLPRLERWAHGRLPYWARGAADTHDLVQDAFIQVLRRLQDFEPRHEGAFHAYLRQALLNKIRDQIRAVNRRPVGEPLAEDWPATDPSPLEEAIGQQALERYEAALARLRPEDREAIILRIEMRYPYAEIAAALDKPSVAAANMAVSRALVKLAEEMSRGHA
jgi:RNA polymerase sigma-70 factor, ECF subfamily